MGQLCTKHASVPQVWLGWDSRSVDGSSGLHKRLTALAGALPMLCVIPSAGQTQDVGGRPPPVPVWEPQCS